MPTDLVLDTEKYISSKRASEITGYAQDYIGQLSRGSLIDARRIGGLWYVSMDSLLAYKNKADDFKPKQPAPHDKIFPDADAFVHLDGKEYISANRASKITGYNQDYVGQLARGGKIVSRQIGNRWYVDKDALLAHKTEKDALLAAVQVESVGIQDKSTFEIHSKPTVIQEPLLRYLTDEGDLLPDISEEKKARSFEDIGPEDTHAVPIRIVKSPSPDTSVPRAVESIDSKADTRRKNLVRISGKSINKALIPVFTLTIVVVLYFGLVSLKKEAIYAAIHSHTDGSLGVVNHLSNSSLIANASSAFDALITLLEKSLTTELVYQRS